MKQNWRPGTMVYPLPAVLVTCGSTPEEYNVFTAAWTGTICSDPAMCYVSIRPERFSHAIVTRNMEFTINLTTRHLARATDWCGVRSGRDYDKFKEMNLTPQAGVKVASQVYRPRNWRFQPRKSRHHGVLPRAILHAGRPFGQIRLECAEKEKKY